MVFNKFKRLTKRNGYGQITALPSSAIFLTTFNENLTAVGSDLQAYVAGTNSWVNKGTLQPVSLTTLPLIRNNSTQIQVDTALSTNNLVCTVYTETGNGSTVYKYAVADSITGQNVLPPAVIPTTVAETTAPRVFYLGTHFVIVFGTAGSLRYATINSNNPQAPTASVTLSAQFSPDSRLNWDGVVANNTLYIGWNGTDIGGAIRVTSLSSQLVQSATSVTAGQKANVMSLSADTSGSTANIYVTYWNASTTTIYTEIFSHILTPVLLAPTAIVTSITVANIATVANNDLETIYYEVPHSYTYDTSIPTNFIRKTTITLGGTVGTPITFARSVGLGSKAFMVDDLPYVLGVYTSPAQPTYFLLNSLGQVVSEFAYSNAGGYKTTGLPSVTVNGDNANVSYQFADLVQSINKNQSVANPLGVYTQTGLNNITFTLGVIPSAVEIGNTLGLTGGFLWTYDGYSPVENNFFLWPDSVEGTPLNTGGSMLPQTYFYQVVYSWADNQGNQYNSAPSIPIEIDMTSGNPAFTQPTPITFTATGATGSKTITPASMTGIEVGQEVTDTTNPGSLAVGTYITKVGMSTFEINTPVITGLAGDTLSISSICSVTVNVPTLRLTYKTLVKIRIFRWSTLQQNYFETTSISMPLFNDPTVDFVTFTDMNADNQILGNSLIYTTGGVIEDTAAPSFNNITLFDDRFWGIDAEDPNLLWYSKQVIEATPIEMSNLFTLYVAPSLASQGSSGILKCMAPMDDKLILFKANALYYINGVGPDNTGTNSQYSQPTFIAGTVGSTNQASIVYTPEGLMFQSDRGIWLLDRNLQTSYIGAPVEDFTLGAIIDSAVSVPETNQIRFTLNTGVTLMYDYFFQQWGAFTNVKATSSTIYNSLHTFIDSFGRVFQETPGKYLDGSLPVLQAFTTGWIAAAGLQGYQRAYWLHLLGTYYSPHILQLQLAYDYNSSPSQCSYYNPQNYSQPWGNLPNWGAGSVWGGPSNVEKARLFFDRQKCQAIQISMDEVFDPSFNTEAGQGLTLSGLNLTVGLKKSYRTSPASQDVG